MRLRRASPGVGRRTPCPRGLAVRESSIQGTQAFAVSLAQVHPVFLEQVVSRVQLSEEACAQRVLGAQHQKSIHPLSWMVFRLHSSPPVQRMQLQNRVRSQVHAIAMIGREVRKRIQ